MDATIGSILKEEHKSNGIGSEFQHCLSADSSDSVICWLMNYLVGNYSGKRLAELVSGFLRRLGAKDTHKKYIWACEMYQRASDDWYDKTDHRWYEFAKTILSREDAMMWPVFIGVLLHYTSPIEQESIMLAFKSDSSSSSSRLPPSRKKQRTESGMANPDIYTYPVGVSPPRDENDE